jgi:hypothetical protein
MIKNFIIIMFMYLFSSYALAAIDCDNQQLLTSPSCIGDSLNQEEFTLHNLVNTYRAENGLETVALSPSLLVVANRHARNLQENSGIVTYDESDCSYSSGEQMPNSCLWKASQKLEFSYLGNNYENIHNAIEVHVIPLEALRSWRQNTENSQAIFDNSIWQNTTWDTLGIGIHQNYAVFWFGKKIDDKSILKRRAKARTTSAQSGKILELYSAYFNRAADANGLKFWIGRFSSYFEYFKKGATDSQAEEYAFNEVAKEISKSNEFLTLYPPTQSAEEFVNRIYTNLLGRASDAEGLAFWVGHIHAGTMAKEQAILRMIDGAKYNTSRYL